MEDRKTYQDGIRYSVTRQGEYIGYILDGVHLSSDGKAIGEIHNEWYLVDGKRVGGIVTGDTILRRDGAHYKVVKQEIA